MTKLNGTVAFVLMCVDNRFYENGSIIGNILQQIRDTYNVDHIFLRTAAGPEGRILSGDHHFEAAMEDAELLIGAKGVSVGIFLGHKTCAGYPLEDERERDDATRQASDKARSRLGDGLSYHSGVLEEQSDGHWMLNDTTHVM